MKTTEELLELQKEVHEIATKHGWHEEKYTVGHWLGLIMSEVGEMVNADRKGLSAKYSTFDKLTKNSYMTFESAFNIFIKDTLGDEMADVVIRLFDMAHEVHGEKMVWNHTYIQLPWEKTFADKAFYYVKNILDDSVEAINASVMVMYLWAEREGIDLDWHIKMKMRYNETRPYKHGNKKY